MADGGWLKGGGSGSAVDVVGLFGDPAAAKGIAEMVEAGALVSLGTTSDGGALGITVTIDGEWRREYVRNDVELLAYLAEAVPGVTDELKANGARPAADRPSAGSRTRSRRR